MTGFLQSRITFLAAMMVLAGFLSSCVSLSKEECIAADWAVIGETDGAAGSSPQSRFAEHAKACVRADIVPDQSLWNQGYQKGLVRYCTPLNGLQVGENGGHYNNVCPIESSAAFLSAYNVGKNAHSIRKQINDKKNHISVTQRKIKDKISNVPNLSDAEQVQLQYEIAELNKSIIREETEIVRLESKFSIAAQEVQAYRFQLAASQ